MTVLRKSHGPIPQVNAELRPVIRQSDCFVSLCLGGQFGFRLKLKREDTKHEEGKDKQARIPH